MKQRTACLLTSWTERLNIWGHVCVALFAKNAAEQPQDRAKLLVQDSGWPLRTRSGSQNEDEFSSALCGCSVIQAISFSNSNVGSNVNLLSSLRSAVCATIIQWSSWQGMFWVNRTSHSVLAFLQGMTGAMQSEVVAWFKSYGRKVLVATSAAEEGLDVQACELVVRYSVTVTGDTMRSDQRSVIH